MNSKTVRNLLSLLAFLGLSFHAVNSQAAMSDEDLLVALKTDPLANVVQSALAEGMSVDSIIKNTLTIEGMNPRQVLVALCQKGASSRDITEAAAKNGISALIIAAADEECQATDEETQAYTQAREQARAVMPAPARQHTAPAEPYASPSTFQ